MTPAGAFLSSLLPSAAAEDIVVVCNCKHQSPLEILVLIAPNFKGEDSNASGMDTYGAPREFPRRTGPKPNQAEVNIWHPESHGTRLIWPPGSGPMGGGGQSG